jgi:outer membrane protein assembly factor BamB
MASNDEESAMSTTVHQAASPPRPLRLWPGVVLLGLQWVIRFVLPIIAPSEMGTAVLGSLAGALAILVWWLFFSRAPWVERLGAVALMAATLVAIRPLLHPSIAGGMMGMMPMIYALPGLCLALVAWAAVSRRLGVGPRWAALAGATLLACGSLALLRTEGLSGDADSDLAWRWTKSTEERLAELDRTAPPAQVPATSSTVGVEVPATSQTPAVAEALNEVPATSSTVADQVPATSPTPSAAVEAPATSQEATAVEVPATSSTPTATVADWPGFRGADRDGVVRGVRIGTDWASAPPVEVWRRPIGPGWGSFAVHGDVVYTQEQRGDEEAVSCYRLATGEPVWRHQDAARFYESNAGAGPRATPTLARGRLYTFGATGILNALDATTGALLWSHQPPSDTGREVPMWGFAASPLVVGDVVVIATAGTLAAYDAATGERRWIGPPGGGGYSSPHLWQPAGGGAQVLMLGGPGAVGVSPADGRVLWTYPLASATRIVQPALTAEGDLLLGDGDNQDLHRVAITDGPAGWVGEERWTSNGLKPYFSDFVVHAGHAYGFDGNMLAAIDVATGKRMWKGGRYGHGQLLLLADQDLLLVLSEQGKLALVNATPGAFVELARAAAIKGKTWNHPVVVGDLLLVRNGQEMAAFRLPPPALGG